MFFVAPFGWMFCDPSFGGSALDVNSFGCTIHLNGQPTVTDAA